MKVLLVGTGTVGEAIAKLSRGRPWLEKMVLADHDLARAQMVLAEVDNDPRFSAARVDAGRKQDIVDLIRAEGVDLVMNSVDPALRHAPVRGGPRGRRRLRGHGREPVRAASHRPVRQARRHARRPPVRARRRLEGERPDGVARDRDGPGPHRRLREVRGEAPLRRGPRRPHPRRRRHVHRRLRVRDGVQHLDDDRGVPQPAAALREGPRRLVHHRAVLRRRALHLPRRRRAGRVRERRARGGRPRAPRARHPERVLQVRARARSSSRSSRRCTRSGSTRRRRSGSATSRSPRATSSWRSRRIP